MNELERSILGDGDRDEIWRRLCPEAEECFAFEISVGALFGLRLGDGSRIALKVHRTRTEGYLEAMQSVQETLWRRGFPCPRPLGVRGNASLEEWRDDGDFLDAHDPDVRRALATQLARLIDLARDLRPSAELAPFFPGPGGPLWPTPHNVLFDFAATADGADWIDAIARAAKERRDAAVAEVVIGHHDWTVKHVRFAGLRPTVVYDWDSVSAGPEPVYAGEAAAHFTYTEHLPVELWPTVDEALLFLADYEDARGEPFTSGQRGVAHAAAVYARAYTTRCVHALGGDTTPLRLPEYAAAFLQ